LYEDDYYYYVKAVPKINVTAPQINVKRFNTQKNAGLRRGAAGRINNELLPEEEEDFEEMDFDEHYIKPETKKQKIALGLRTET